MVHHISEADWGRKRWVGANGEGACIFVSRTGGEDEVGGSIRRKVHAYL